MRIWSLHPKYLDAKGLVALWREALLGKNVLEGKTRGYRNHPQLRRFRQEADPVEAINQYLYEIYRESVRRNYNFDIHKIDCHYGSTMMNVTNGQLDYEVRHLLGKLKTRDINRYQILSRKNAFDTHPMFNLVHGDIESWEILAGE